MCLHNTYCKKIFNTKVGMDIGQISMACQKNQIDQSSYVNKNLNFITYLKNCGGKRFENKSYTF